MFIVQATGHRSVCKIGLNLGQKMYKKTVNKTEKLEDKIVASF
jgi:hypothetical protein